MAGIHTLPSEYTQLDISYPVWDQFYTVAPLIVIGTKEKGSYNMAPKHMATPLGHSNYYCFICTPDHSTYHNIKEHSFFTVSYPKPDNIVLTSLAASPRCGDNSGEKNIINNLPAIKAPNIDALFLKGSYLLFECELLKIIDGFDKHSIITGKITNAYVDTSYLKISDKDEQELIASAPLLSYLAYGRFAEIKESKSFPFPKNFKG